MTGPRQPLRDAPAPRATWAGDLFNVGIVFACGGIGALIGLADMAFDWIAP